MDLLWYAVLVLLLGGYFALEGSNIGLGMLLPALGRDQPGRDRLVAAMAPFVLAGEVWLVAAVGVLFGAFPQLEGEVIFALYPLVVALLAGWVVRDAGLWFRRRVEGPRWRAFWDGALCAGSWVLALAWGFALAAIAGGLHGPVITLPGALGALVVAAVLAFHGRTWAAWRLPDAIPGGTPGGMSDATPGGVRGGGRAGWALCGSAALAALPAVLPLAVAAPAVLEHAAPSQTLSMVGLMVVPFVPFMVAAQVGVWRIFGRRRSRDAGTPSFF
ncbi:hypothetical protein Misp01_17830 [Microtetraspora sp. NBRC 13810]|uniref:cytochrome d ubiquinol oxidase subunit II n=1 Tax=Microtetraspora sp. NBRC 13810 TaxID=3030990 RepID=UPI0024A02932|nr:cytochrome d ubiquinol oxidase subunit II [Microtetraspora sp. NBRC 13810]GLW06653.1 hypothetical protein Misp01_17830 [Microtetraspora sp. NBRC 13810]